jgi:hypothetical protein
MPHAVAEGAAALELVKLTPAWAEEDPASKSLNRAANGPMSAPFHCLGNEYSPDGSRSFRAFTCPFSITNS